MTARFTFQTLTLIGVATTALLSPTHALACACGCGIFDVGGNTIMLPETGTASAPDQGLSVFFRFATMDQDRNREGSAVASPDDNSDKRIQTDFYTLGVHDQLNRSWAIMAELPIYDRRFTTTATDDAGNTGVQTFPLTDLGDAMLRVIYTGFSADLSTGVDLGVKLPTGRYTSPTYGSFTQNPPFDRDSLPGTGSTDIEVGAYHLGPIAGPLGYFAQGRYQVAVATRDDYRPGNELDGAVGVTYALSPPGGAVGVVPTLQLLGSVRAHDTGLAADPRNSGYRRLLLAPGVSLRLSRHLSVYGDVEWPIAQSVHAASSPAIEGTAGQLTAPALFKLQVNYRF